MQVDTASDAAGEAVATSPAASALAQQRDIEAPEVFQAQEAGLWDGRPSLGGVWVAHPDVTEPQRVLIRNESNDRFIIGALFRRERDIPGPRLQVSSDAAVALGMLAGQPVELDVTALRREEPQPEPEPEPTPEAEAEPEDAVIQPAEAAPAAALAASEDAVPTAEVAAEPAPKQGFFATLFAPKPQAGDAEDTPDEVASLQAPAVVETSQLDDAVAAPGEPYIQTGIFSDEANATQLGRGAYQERA